MEGIYKEVEVICCFCGNSLAISEAMVLSIQSKIDSEEVQQLYCHKEHFPEKMDKSIFIYIDIGSNKS